LLFNWRKKEKKIARAKRKKEKIDFFHKQKQRKYQEGNNKTILFFTRRR